MNFKNIKFKNGLRLILSPMTETKAVTALVLFKVGSRYEKKEINGISHFVEHMMFKGTKKRPSTLDISKVLDSVGAEYNAFTAKDHTGYYVKVSADKIELAMDVLSDILYNSKFDSQEIEREKPVIVEEINMVEDNPMMYIGDLFEQTIYGQEPLGWQISGSRDNVRDITREKIIDYMKNYYQHSNMVIGIAGRFDRDILDLTKKYFHINTPKKPTFSFKKIKIVQNKPRLRLNFKETEQVHLCLGFPSYSYFDKRIYALYLLSIILGGNMSSRLFISIRERMSLAYFIRSAVSLYQDTGNLVIQAGLDKKRVEEAIQAILEELKKMKKEKVSPEELKKAKDYLKGKLILELESSENIASWLSKQELLLNKIITPKQQIIKLEKVTSQDIQRAANDIMKDAKVNLAMIGPFKEPAKFQKLLKI